DRGYAFEQQLNENTAGVLDKPLAAYRNPEIEAKIPMMVLSPTIVNDGRKLFISPQKMAYMCTPSIFQIRYPNQKVKGIDFLRFFEKQDSPNLRFLSALRMSATFPYVAPNIKLPSEPEIQIMDAGISDNFGVEAAARFIFVFQEWIRKNTSGVIIVSIRDTQKNKRIEKRIQSSWLQRFFTPLEGMYMNQEYMQDINNDNLIELLQSSLQRTKIYRVEFEYVPISKSLEEIQQKIENNYPSNPNKIITIERAVLSWHLTEKEKQSLYRTIYEIRNRNATKYLASLLKVPIGF
ncbi:MAG: patatin-like phospholipase family protein, partial [Thermonemataceae bacterium]|nr:patatin-like phospholipase family protein [Thermonemataceae bacterium]